MYEEKTNEIIDTQIEPLNSVDIDEGRALNATILLDTRFISKNADEWMPHMMN